MSSDVIQGMIRHFLNGLGVFLTSQGIVDADTVQTAIGAFLTLFSVGWSVKSKVS
jgi:hypothetical protein